MLRPGQRVDVLINWPPGADDEISVYLDDETESNTLAQTFSIKISGFVNSNDSLTDASAYRHISTSATGLFVWNTSSWNVVVCNAVL
jgi:hypothetical protein